MTSARAWAGGMLLAFGIGVLGTLGFLLALVGVADRLFGAMPMLGTFSFFAMPFVVTLALASIAAVLTLNPRRPSLPAVVCVALAFSLGAGMSIPLTDMIEYPHGAEGPLLGQGWGLALGFASICLALALLAGFVVVRRMRSRRRRFVELGLCPDCEYPMSAPPCEQCGGARSKGPVVRCPLPLVVVPVLACVVAGVILWHGVGSWLDVHRQMRRFRALGADAFPGLATTELSIGTPVAYPAPFFAFGNGRGVILVRWKQPTRERAATLVVCERAQAPPVLLGLDPPLVVFLSPRELADVEARGIPPSVLAALEERAHLHTTSDRWLAEQNADSVAPNAVVLRLEDLDEAP